MALATALPVLLAACQSSGPGAGTVGYVRGFLGGVAGDEPQAVIIARDVLSAGGSAADAAVAAYFTMAVTYPSAASLGSGGACLVHDREKSAIEALDFTHPTTGALAGIPVPASPRGMFLLHAKYGRLPWAQLVAPGEGLARFGNVASRALVRALAEAPGVLQDPAARAIFGGAAGGAVREGEKIQQFQLATALGLLRREPGQFFAASFARRVAEAYREAGVAMTADNIRDYRPRFMAPVSVKRGNQAAEFAPTPAGVVAAQMWAMLYRERIYAREGEDERPHLIAEVSRRAFADAGRWFGPPGVVGEPVQPMVEEGRIKRLLGGFRRSGVGPVSVAGTPRPGPEPRDQGSASVVAADRDGQSVACAFTMNGIMGSAKVAAGTGIVIAAPPDPAGRGVPALALMVQRLEVQDQAEYVGAATGGAVAPVALVTTALGIMEDNRGAEAALAGPRFYRAAQPDRVMLEDRPDARPIADLLRRSGHDVAFGPPAMGRVNVYTCPEGFEPERGKCDVRTDRRGHGLAQQN